MKNLLLTILLSSSLCFALPKTIFKLNSDINFTLSETAIELTFKNNFNISSMNLTNLSTNEITSFPFVNQYNSLRIDLENYSFGGYVLNIENDNFIEKIMLYVNDNGLSLIDNKKVLKPIYQNSKNNLLIKVLDSSSIINISIISDRGDEIYSNKLNFIDLNNKVFNFGYEIDFVTVYLNYDDQKFKKQINF